MRFVILIKATKASEAGVFPDAKFLAEMGKYNHSSFDENLEPEF